MIRAWKLWLRIVLFFATSSAALSQDQRREAPPVPTPIITAHSIFISNLGTNLRGASLLTNEPDMPYVGFYSAMKSWGRYTLVSAPADADLVFETHFEGPTSSEGYWPRFEVHILDGKTHFTLWTLTVPVRGANRKATFEKNWDQAITNLMSDLKKLATQPPS